MVYIKHETSWKFIFVNCKSFASDCSFKLCTSNWNRNTKSEKNPALRRIFSLCAEVAHIFEQALNFVISVLVEMQVGLQPDAHRGNFLLEVAKE